MAMPLSSKKNLAPRRPAHSSQHLRISDVAKRIGISSSALRAWEALGLLSPRRSRGKYRLYTAADVRLLQRAIFLRRSRGLNPAAVVHILKRGAPTAASESAAHPGHRFRRLRLARGLSLAQVARSTSVSTGFLSALERGQMRASIATLKRIARFYKTNILSFFEPSAQNQLLVSPAQRKVLETTPGVRMELLAWGNTSLEPHLFRIKPGGGSGESYTHVGEEFLHILKGQLELWLNETEHYLLRAGDSFCFQSSIPHRWRNSGRGETCLLWINTPPSF
ncbi:MAG: cupin domain-containing protein [Acidobacteriia bacterium]|nr:cupin domain-containing protein [Terriglobia bacterium]